MPIASTGRKQLQERNFAFQTQASLPCLQLFVISEGPVLKRSQSQQIAPRHKGKTLPLLRCGRSRNSGNNDRTRLPAAVQGMKQIKSLVDYVFVQNKIPCILTAASIKAYAKTNRAENTYITAVGLMQRQWHKCEEIKLCRGKITKS